MTTSGASVPVALGVRNAVVEPEQVGLVVVAVLDDHDDVVEDGGQLVREVVEGVGDEPLEAVAGDDVHAGGSVDLERRAEDLLRPHVDGDALGRSRGTPAPLSLSGSTAVIGRPSSPPSRSAGTSGSWPSSGTPSSSASSAPPPEPKIS